MAKVRNALFSFGASGTVGKIVNIQPRATGQIVRIKPSAAAPPTMAQAYYRTRFADAARSWRQLDHDTRQDWRAYAAARARPPFAAYWLEYQAQKSTPTTPPYLPALDPE